MGKKILVDVERGRTVRGWKPRRLGGGLGGRPKKVEAPPPRTSTGPSTGGDRGGGGGGFRGGFGGRGGGGFGDRGGFRSRGGGFGGGRGGGFSSDRGYGDRGGGGGGFGDRGGFGGDRGGGGGGMRGSYGGDGAGEFRGGGGGFRGGRDDFGGRGGGGFRYDSLFYSLLIVHLSTGAAAAVVSDITEEEDSTKIPATATVVHQVVQEVCPGAVGTEVAVIAQTSNEKVQEGLMIENINDRGISLPSSDGGIFFSLFSSCMRGI